MHISHHNIVTGTVTTKVHLSVHFSLVIQLYKDYEYITLYVSKTKENLITRHFSIQEASGEEIEDLD